MIVRALAATLLALALFGAPPAARADGLSALERAYFDASWARDPSDATQAGVHRFDGALDTYTPQTVASRIAEDDDELLFAQERDWRRQPDFYVGRAGQALYGVIERPYAPLEVRVRYAIARERAIPRFLRDAERNLDAVDATSASLGYDDARGTADFFTQTVPASFGRIGDAKLAAFAAWIARGPRENPTGNFAIGSKLYAARLKYEEGLDMPLDADLAVGEGALAATRAQFVAVAKSMNPKASPESVFESLRSHHPTAAALLPTAQSDLAGLRAFVVSHHIVTLPADANIKVVPTPVFLRATTFASMDAPGPLERAALAAYYNVTPVDTTLPKAQQEQQLQFYNDATLPLTSAHEVYPGHYTNYVIDQHLPLSLTRRLLNASSFAEGWAHYDEQMMVDEGWGNGAKDVRLAQLDYALLRECRFVVGVKEHTACMSVAEATTFFERNAFLPQPAALKEALRGAGDPLYGYYTLGKLDIHDALLAHGDPPIPLLRPLLLGNADDGKVL